MGEVTALSDLQKRCIYRACHRGTKEMDWLLGNFVTARGAALQLDEIRLLDAFMDHADPLLEGWIVGRGAPVEAEFAGLVAEIRKFHKL